MGFLFAQRFKNIYIFNKFERQRVAFLLDLLGVNFLRAIIGNSRRLNHDISIVPLACYGFIHILC
ncbi:hypothetical protein D3C74_490340 [compost metagenome]